MSTALVLRRSQDVELERAACASWLVYLRTESEDIMIDVSKTRDLRTVEEVLLPFRGHGDVYGVPVW